MVLLRNLTDWVQCSVHKPSPFIGTHVQDLLPSWQNDLASVIVILQRCPVSLSRCTVRTEHQKNVLRDRFIHIGNLISHQLQTFGHEAELFDPKSGLPLTSSHGIMHLDDVAVARQSLRYSVSTQGLCTYLVHPIWGNAVYPATLISDAPPITVQRILHNLVLPNGYAHQLSMNETMHASMHHAGLNHHEAKIPTTLISISSRFPEQLKMYYDVLLSQANAIQGMAPVHQMSCP
ncbi:MAG: methylmalonic aciduria and homocystinuria type D protein [Cyanobacteria bacterium P01_A01_bin.37]